MLGRVSLFSLLSRRAPPAERWMFYNCGAGCCQSQVSWTGFLPFFRLSIVFPVPTASSEVGAGGGEEGGAGSELLAPDVGFWNLQRLPKMSLLLSLRFASLIIKHRSSINIWTPWRQLAIISNSVPTATPPQLQRKLITRLQILQITFPSSQMMYISSS